MVGIYQRYYGDITTVGQFQPAMYKWCRNLLQGLKKSDGHITSKAAWFPFHIRIDISLS